MLNRIKADIEAIKNVLRGVADFIGTIWSRIYKYVGSQLKPLFTFARDIAQSAYNSAVGYVNAFIGGIYKKITDVWNDAKHFVITKVAEGVTVVKNFVNGLIDGVRKLASEARDLVNWAISWFAGQVNSLVSDIIKIYRWIFDTGNAIANIVMKWLTIFTTDNLARFLYLVINLFPSIFNFFKDPVSFVTLWLEPMLLDMIYWLLAYDLGTKEASLPDKPKNYG